MPKLTRHRQSVHPRHADIEKNEIRRSWHRLLNGFETILRLATDLALGLEDRSSATRAAHPLVVIGDQDSHKVPEL